MIIDTSKSKLDPMEYINDSGYLDQMFSESNRRAANPNSKQNMKTLSKRVVLL